MNQNKNIIGKWIKIKLSFCGEKYPDELNFLKNGIYSGSKGENKKEFTIWDAGSYEIISDNRIKISTANDKEIIYHFSTHNNLLNFVDEENCEIQYKRIK
jgi:hypothetical protein